MAYDNLRLEKGMYRESGKTFTQVLEKLDPSEHYKGTALEGLDAFQRQLKRFDIHVKGSGSDCVEKFFRTMDSAVLFPEFIARSVRQGMEENNILPSITATTTVIDAMDYRSIYSVPEEDDKMLMDVEEGTAIPATTVKTKEHLNELRKRGRMLVASYEAVRFQKLDLLLDLFSVMLRQIGSHIAAMHLQDAISVLVDGDGNDNAAQVMELQSENETDGTESTASTAAVPLTYDALVEFWAKFHPYSLNAMLCGGDVMVQMLKIKELQDPMTGLNFQGTGSLKSPLGADLWRTDAVPEGMLIGLDRRYALELIQAGEVSVEYDKLIDRQLERAAITSISGFGKICADAVKVLTL